MTALIFEPLGAGPVEKDAAGEVTIVREWPPVQSKRGVLRVFEVRPRWGKHVFAFSDELRVVA